ncbi:DeoR/GlpR family DNA-binding transcription regulator [Kibdelosporangium aridum]|nr:DeoR/GlpR family DNA-binding transcription regulator [Kibdelosporangium aridum]
MRRSDRLNAIMERLAKDGSVAVTALSRGLGVSEASVRRDLSFLEAQKWLSRTHGGAVARSSLPASVSVVAERQAERFRIAELAAAQVPDGARIGLAAGPLSVLIVRSLADRESLTVVTNELDAAYEASLRPGVRVMVPGGVTTVGSSVLTGSMLRDVYLDLAIVGGDGVSAEAGLTTEDVPVADTARSFMDAAGRAIGVFDTPQVGAAAFARICALSDVASLITAEDVDPDARARIEGAGVPVVTQ